MYRWLFASDLQTQNLVNLIRVGSPSCRYLCKSSKGMNLIRRSLSHLYILFAVIYVQFIYFYTLLKKLMGKSVENMTEKKTLAIILENSLNYIKIVKHYMELLKITIERIRKKFEII